MIGPCADQCTGSLRDEISASNPIVVLCAVCGHGQGICNPALDGCYACKVDRLIAALGNGLAQNSLVRNSLVRNGLWHITGSHKQGRSPLAATSDPAIDMSMKAFAELTGLGGQVVVDIPSEIRPGVDGSRWQLTVLLDFEDPARGNIGGAELARLGQVGVRYSRHWSPNGEGIMTPAVQTVVALLAVTLVEAIENLLGLLKAVLPDADVFRVEATKLSVGD